MLRFLLKPGEAVMERLRFPAKFMLVVFLIAVPISYLSYNYTVDLNRAIATPERQRVGTQFVRSAGNFMKEVQRHRGTASRVLNGDAAAKQTLLEYQAKAEGAIGELDALGQQFGQTLETTDRWTTIKADWESLKGRLSTLTAPQSFEAHSRLVADIQRFIDHVAGTSALNTNSVLDEYHLSSLTTQTLPRLSESQGKQRAVGSGAATRKAATLDEKIQLHVLKADAEASVERARVSLDQVFRLDPDLKQRLEQKAAAMTDLAAAYQSLIDREVLKPDVITIAGGVYFDEATKAIDAVFVLHDEAIDALDEHLSERIAGLEADRARALAIAWGTMALMAYFLLVFLTSARRGLRVVEAASQRMMQGDLRIDVLPVQSRDEIGQVAAAITQTAHNLRELIGGVTDSIHSVRAAAEGLSANSGQAADRTRNAGLSADQMAAGASDQAAAAAEVSETMEQLQATIQQMAQGSQEIATQIQQASTEMEQIKAVMLEVAANAHRVATNSASAAEGARSGVAVVGRTVEGMERIRSVVHESAGRIRDLEQVTVQIGEITQLISDMSEQTNLLALNAAIEAARAGEHGRGFAVVAEEVRRLAERSNRSARDIAQLIANIQLRTAEAVKSMEAGTAEVATGTQLAHESGRVLREILATVEQSALDVASISTAAEQARRNVEQEARSFEAVAAVTEESTASTEEMAAAAGQVAGAMERVALVSQANAAEAGAISAAVRDLNSLSDSVAASARELTLVAGRLQEQVARIQA